MEQNNGIKKGHRIVLLDTETTGLSVADGHKLFEIGCIEIIDRRFTGNTYHTYLNTDKEIDAGATKVHGITNEALKGELTFSNIASDFLKFIDGAELVAHNAPFDVGFINNELSLIEGESRTLADLCKITDTLVMARAANPTARASLDALAKRYGVDSGDRTLHGALLDCEILGEVYLKMTGGQKDLKLEEEKAKVNKTQSRKPRKENKRFGSLRVVKASDDDIIAHNTVCDAIGSAYSV